MRSRSSHEFKLALRVLRRSRAFSAGMVLVVALVIGAGTALFSSIYGLAFPRLPYPGVSRLVVIESLSANAGSNLMSAGEFRAVQDSARDLEGVAAYVTPPLPDWVYSDRILGTQQVLSVAGCTAGLFRLLGVAPALGRAILPSDEREGAPRVAVLSNRFWREHFGANPQVLGQALAIDHFGRMVPYVVVGVMPPGVAFPYPLGPARPDLWANEYADGSSTFSLRGGYLGVIGRLRPSVSLAAAQAEILGIATRLHRQQPREYSGRAMRVVPLRSELVRDEETVLVVLGIAMGLMLLVGCANIASMLLIRAIGREREMAVRAALGASRTALVRQQLAELLPLLAAGGALGIVLAYWVVKAFFAFAPPSTEIAKLGTTSLGLEAFAWTGLGLSVVAMVAAVAPVLIRAKQNIGVLKRAGDDAPSRGRALLRRSGRLLVVLQVSLGLTLVTGSTALGLDLHRQLASDGAFRPARLLALEVGLSNAVPNGPGHVSQMLREFTERVEAIPGVQAATLCDGFPEPDIVFASFEVPGGSGKIGESYQGAEVHAVSPNFFQAMGFRLLRGRDFEPGDSLDSQAVAVVNSAMADRYFPGRDPTGLVLRSSTSHGVTGNRVFTIIGVVREPRRFGTGRQAAPAVYLSLRQEPARRVSVVVRSKGDPASVAGALRRAALEIAPGEVYLGPLRTGEELVARSVARARFITALVAAFGALALLLLAIGTYGVVSYDAAMRTRETAIRLALGATPVRAGLLMLRRGMLPVLAGCLWGLLGSYLFARAASAFLYGFRQSGTLPYLASAGLVLAVAIAACYPPARRASRADPSATLQAE